MIDVEQLALQRSRYPELSDADFRFYLQQVDGRQRTERKLPTFAQRADWWYPVRLSCEQCSSELSARHKAQLLLQHPALTNRAPQSVHCVDLTGGYGVDAYFLFQTFGTVDYIERDTELCRIATHNFSRYAPNIHIHNTTAEDFLSTMSPVDILCLDPARRNKNGGKVFKLEDCEPNVLQLLPLLREKAQVLLLKSSPMLDITAALRSLHLHTWDVHVVALDNEVKEVLLLTAATTDSQLNALNIRTHEDTEPHYDLLQVPLSAEHSATPTYADHIGQYLYEPNAAILKAGLYNTVSQHFNLYKLAPNTHLYTSDTLIPNFFGRVWKIDSPDIYTKSLSQANVLTRNYPLTPDQLKKKLHLRDGGEHYLIGTRLASHPILLTASRVQ